MMKKSCEAVILIPQSREKDLLFDKSTTKQILRPANRNGGRRPPQNDIVGRFSSTR
jgi:hypothetical protein